MKVLQGSLIETQYDWPETDGAADTATKTVMTPRKKTVFNENDVAYMSDKVCKTTLHNCLHIHFYMLSSFLFAYRRICYPLSKKKQKVKSKKRKRKKNASGVD